MPLLEFRCTQCEHIFEELILTKSDSVQVRCPVCQSTNVEKIYSTFAVSSGGRFSGSGGSTCTGCSKTSCSGCSK